MENETFSTQEELSLNEMTQITGAEVHCGDLEDLMDAYIAIGSDDALALAGDVCAIWLDRCL